MNGHVLNRTSGLFVRPSNWEVVREFSVQHVSRVDDPILEADPRRELAEEFADALGISLIPDQYSVKPVATLVEDDPVPTENIHARGYPTASVYRVFEAYILDSSLALGLMANSESLSDQVLCQLATEDAQNGGKGRANAVLALPMKLVQEVYLALPPNERNAPVLLEKNRLDRTVPAVLEGIMQSKHQLV